MPRLDLTPGRTLRQPGLDEIPVFPLPQVVLFPGATLPLHIFEPRYRTMLAHCLTKHDGDLVIAQVDRSGTRIAEIAGAGTIIEHQPLPDGRSNIIVVGAVRVRLEQLLPEDETYPYKRARAKALESKDVSVSESDRTALVAAATMFATEVKKHDPSFSFSLPRADAAIGELADICAFHLVVDSQVRQALLEELDPRTRVRKIVDQLALQHTAMLGDAKGAVLN